MARRSPTLVELHVRELHRRFMTVHHRGMAALSVGDVEAFGDAIRQEQAIIDERAAALRDYAEQCHKRQRSLRERLQRLVEARSGTLDAGAVQSPIAERDADGRV